jgi:hypothetical protein
MAADHQGGQHEGRVTHESGVGHLQRILGASAVSGAPPIATYRRAAIRAAVRSTWPIAEIRPFFDY